MPHLNIYAGLYTLLTADQTAGSFYDDLTGRIYPTQAVVGEDLPLCTFGFSSDSPDKYFTGNDVDATLQVSIWMDSEIHSPEDIVAVNDKLVAILEDATPTFTAHSCGQIRSIDTGVLDRQEQAWVIQTLWTVTATAD